MTINLTYLVQVGNFLLCFAFLKRYLLSVLAKASAQGKRERIIKDAAGHKVQLAIDAVIQEQVVRKQAFASFLHSNPILPMLEKQILARPVVAIEPLSEARAKDELLDASNFKRLKFKFLHGLV